MTTYFQTIELVSNNGHKVKISKTIGKFCKTPFWRVAVSYNGIDYYVFKDYLRNKPNKRQIENYLATL